MSNTVRIALAAAAVVVVALIGYQFLIAPNVGGPGPSPSPSQSPALEPTASQAAAFPPAGPVAVGRHAMTLVGLPVSLELTTEGWGSNGMWGLDRGNLNSADSAGFLFWPTSAPDNTFGDPCAEALLDPPAEPSAAGLAAAVSTVAGTELVSGPSATTVGGYPAQYVVITVPENIGCAANAFYLWEDLDTEGAARYATQKSSTIHVWIVDVDGTIVWIDAETYLASGPEVAQEIEQIVNSLQFE